MINRATALALACAGTVCLVGCDETDVASMRITLDEELSGGIVITCLRRDGNARAAGDIVGVTMVQQAQVVSRAGRFANLSDVEAFDITFEAGETAAGVHYVTVRLPPPAEALWDQSLTVPDAEQRRDATRAFGPAPDAEKLGSRVKIQITVPGEVLSEGVSGENREIVSRGKGPTAVLLVPLDWGEAGGEAVLWHVTWL